MIQQLIIFCIFSYSFILGLFYYQQKIVSLYFSSVLYIFFYSSHEHFFIILLSAITTSLSLFHASLYLYLLRTILPSLIILPSAINIAKYQILANLLNLNLS